MICKKPFVRGLVAFGCGQCLPCRINKRRIWTIRIFFELQYHEKAAFVTLTYDNEHLPKGGSLSKEDLKKFIKALRKRNFKIRYFAVGEYGDQTERPHYHLLIFGMSMLESEMIHKVWGKGNVYVGNCTLESAQYVAGYVTKKMTSKDDPRLNGKTPEFARMSLKPGIGFKAVEQIKTDLTRTAVNGIIKLPTVVQVGGKKWPLGRYIKRKIEDSFNVNHEHLVRNTMLKNSVENVIAMEEDRQKGGELSLKAILVKKVKGRIESIESKYKIYRQKGRKL